MKTLLTSLVIILGSGAWLFSALRLEERQIHNLQIPLGQPHEIVWPCEVAIVGDLGENGLRIGANIGRGWRGEAAGHARYRFYVPADGTYTLWAYVDWFDECANAVYVQFDEADKIILGNDPVYQQWHWVRGIDTKLSKGTHVLTLSNHSDHIALETLFLSSSPHALPDQSEHVFSDIFYEGFDGCDQGNFNQWDAVSGKWQVLNPFDEMAFNQNILVNRTETDAILVCPQRVKPHMSIQVSIFHSEEPDNLMQAGIRFGIEDDTNYYHLSWRDTHVRLYRFNNGTKKLLSEFTSPFIAGKWHDITIALHVGHCEITIDQEETQTIATADPIVGQIALTAQKQTSIYFDNIHIRENNDAPTR